MNALYNRDANCPTNFQAELFADGRFEYRYPDHTTRYAPVFPFDWDGDGLENTVDPEPMVAGPDAHGANVEWYNNVCSNVYSATEVDGEIVLSPRNSSVNTNAYYFVDVVAEFGPTPIYFMADGESRLGNPVIVARAGETNHVPLLIGADYCMSSSVPVSISASFFEDTTGIELRRNSDLTVCAISLEGIKFNHDYNAHTNDAINIRLDGATNGVYAIGNGEWSGRGMTNCPACSGAPRYLKKAMDGSSLYFDLTDYAISNTNVVNCYDQAHGLVSFANLLGASSHLVYTKPFGYLVPADLIGVGECNNPFFEGRMTSIRRVRTTNGLISFQSVIVPRLPLCGVDDISRSLFGNHMYTVYMGKVWDACAGPSLGVYSNGDYLQEVIDHSTENERINGYFNNTATAEHVDFGDIFQIK